MENKSLTVLNSIPTAQEFQTMKDLGNMAVKSGFLPTSIRTAEQAIIIMLKGRELGIPPMQAFSSIAVVNGKPTMSAELMLSMIYKNVPGAVVNFISTTSQECVIEAKRPNGKATKFSFTMADARTAGLINKGPWTSYPAAMLRARCISAMARAMFPDALSGVVYTAEELGAEVDDEGNVIDVSPAIEPVVEKAEREVQSQPVQIVEPEQKAPAVDAEAIILDTADPGEYKVSFGRKYKGKKLKEIPKGELKSYIDWLENSGVRPGTSLDQQIHFLRVAFDQMYPQESNSSNTRWDNSNEDIPF